jgi:hypothetical protein
MKFTNSEALKLGNIYKINFDVVPFEEFKDGLNIELEHGTKLSKISNIANITNNNKNATIAIVCAHLIEDPRYYHYLKILETKREKYWSTRKKPSIFL